MSDAVESPDFLNVPGLEDGEKPNGFYVSLDNPSPEGEKAGCRVPVKYMTLEQLRACLSDGEGCWVQEGKRYCVGDLVKCVRVSMGTKFEAGDTEVPDALELTVDGETFTFDFVAAGYATYADIVANLWDVIDAMNAAAVGGVWDSLTIENLVINHDPGVSLDLGLVVVGAESVAVGSWGYSDATVESVCEECVDPKTEAEACRWLNTKTCMRVYLAPGVNPYDLDEEQLAAQQIDPAKVQGIKPDKFYQPDVNGNTLTLTPNDGGRPYVFVVNNTTIVNDSPAVGIDTVLTPGGGSTQVKDCQVLETTETVVGNIPAPPMPSLPALVCNSVTGQLGFWNVATQGWEWKPGVTWSNETDLSIDLTNEAGVTETICKCPLPTISDTASTSPTSAISGFGLQPYGTLSCWTDPASMAVYKYLSTPDGNGGVIWEPVDCDPGGPIEIPASVITDPEDQAQSEDEVTAWISANYPYACSRGQIFTTAEGEQFAWMNGQATTDLTIVGVSTDYTCDVTGINASAPVANSAPANPPAVGADSNHLHTEQWGNCVRSYRWDMASWSLCWEAATKVLERIAPASDSPDVSTFAGLFPGGVVRNGYSVCVPSPTDAACDKVYLYYCGKWSRLGIEQAAFMEANDLPFRAIDKDDPLDFEVGHEITFDNTVAAGRGCVDYLLMLFNGATAEHGFLDEKDWTYGPIDPPLSSSGSNGTQIKSHLGGIYRYLKIDGVDQPIGGSIGAYNSFHSVGWDGYTGSGGTTGILRLALDKGMGSLYRQYVVSKGDAMTPRVCYRKRVADHCELHSADLAIIAIPILTQV